MKNSYIDECIRIVPIKIDAHASEGYNKDRSDKKSIGKYFFQVDVTAQKETVYIPISIASGRQSTGFIYQIEGMGEAIGRASIDGRGEGVVTVTSGSITYFKLMPGQTVSFKILVEVTVARKTVYKVVISRINYKLNTNDPRYKRFLLELPSKPLKFK